MPSEQTNIKVVVRVRPYNQRELDQNQRSIIKVVDTRTLLFDPEQEDDEFFFQGTKQNYRDITKKVNKKLPMDFDRVFDTYNTNHDIFGECTSPLVDSVLNGYNCSVFVYGATGAGKTFTMLGSEASPGLTFLTMADLFNKIELQKSTRKFDVGVSYLEVYNEQVMNLLTKTGPLKLREDSNGVVVSGLVLKPIYSAEELLRLLVLGNANRTQHPTDANAESSRSHAVFQVHIRMTEKKTGTKRTVKLSMIDLAGSERAASTKGIGVRFKEGACINKSLLALGNCINKLADGLKHIPYRDSNLTRLLKDSLGGNCCTLMVANVSMSSLTYEDTNNTLKYASRAKKIRTTLKQNVMKTNMPKEFYVRKVTDLMSENERLMERNKSLEDNQKQMERNATSNGYSESELMPWYSKIDAVYASVLKTQEYVYGIRSKIKNLDFNQRLKVDFENFRKILTSDQRSLQEDFTRFSAYISNLNMQSQKQREELPRWAKKLQDAYKDLESLKREIKDSKQSQILQIYIQFKDLEVKNSKQNIQKNFLYRINTELVENSELLIRSLVKACEIFKHIYDNLETAQKLTPEIQKLYENLQRYMRFKESPETSWNENDLPQELRPPASDSSPEKDEQRTDVSKLTAIVTSLTASSKKRLRPKYTATTTTTTTAMTQSSLNLELDSGDEEDTDTDGYASTESPFKKPRNLNETHVVTFADVNESSSSSIGSNDVGIDSNSIHKKKITKSTVTQSKMTTTSTSTSKLQRTASKRLVTDILSDQNIRSTTDREKIKHALLKSNNFTHQELQRKMAIAVQKENMKLSQNCIRKSPRSIVAKVRKQFTSRLADVASSSSSSSKDPPKVRINRAASFRVNK